MPDWLLSFTSLLVAGIISLVLGIIIIIWPRALAYIVGAYLIIIGILVIIAAVL